MLIPSRFLIFFLSIILFSASFLLHSAFAATKTDDGKQKAQVGEEQCSAKSGNKTGGCPKNATKLLLAQVIFRHGDRTPVFSYPKDPHSHKRSNSTVAQLFQRPGLLTKRGKEQAHELGTFLHALYKDTVLQNIWLPEQVHVQSSEVERTIMTGQTVLAGLFPPSACPEKEPGGCEGKWSKDIKWQPIPVYPIPRKYDNKINFYREGCPAYTAELERVLTCSEMQAYLSQYEKFFQELQLHTGLPSVTIRNAGLIYDTLFVQSTHNLTLANWTKSAYPSPLREMEELGFQTMSGNRKMMRLYGGPLLNEVIGNMKKSSCPRHQMKLKEKGKRPKKLYLYSGHDTTVAAFLATLGLLHSHHPAYTSAVIVELHEPIKKIGGGGGENSDGRISNGTSGSGHIVKVFYRNATGKPLRELIVPACGNPCYLDKLEKVSRDLFVTSWRRECDGTSGWLGWALLPVRKLVAALLKFYAYISGKGDCAVC